MKDFYAQMLDRLSKCRQDWSTQSKIMIELEDVGGMAYCPESIYHDFLKEIVLLYIGESAYGPYSASRKVFFSNGAAPIALRVLQIEGSKIASHLEVMKDKSKSVKNRIADRHVLRRYDDLLDLTA
jgi:hypothetical protein